MLGKIAYMIAVSISFSMLITLAILPMLLPKGVRNSSVRKGGPPVYGLLLSLVLFALYLIQFGRFDVPPAITPINVDLVPLIVGGTLWYLLYFLPHTIIRSYPSLYVLITTFTILMGLYHLVIGTLSGSFWFSLCIGFLIGSLGHAIVDRGAYAHMFGRDLFENDWEWESEGFGVIFFPGLSAFLLLFLTGAIALLPR